MNVSLVRRVSTHMQATQSATDIALSSNDDIVVRQITSALNTSHLATRRLVLDILVFVGHLLLEIP